MKNYMLSKTQVEIIVGVLEVELECKVDMLFNQLDDENQLIEEICLVVDSLKTFDYEPYTSLCREGFEIHQRNRGE